MLLTPNRAITSVAQDVPLRVYSSEEFADVADLKCSPVAEWLSIGTKALAGDNHIVKVPVKAQANTTGAPRTGVVDFTWIDAAGKSHVAQATIAQSASENILDVYVTTLMVPYLGTTELLPIYDNATSVIPKSSNTARVTPSIVTNADTQTKDLKLVIAENETAETLITYVTITAKFDDGTTAEKVITVVQTPKDPAIPESKILEFAMSSVAIPPAGGTEEIDVTTTATDYTVSTTAPWLTVSKGSVIIEAQPNTGDEPREAVVTVRAQFEDGTVIEKTITVTQDALELEVTLLDYQGDPLEAEQTLSGQAQGINAPFEANMTITAVEVTAEDNWFTENQQFEWSDNTMSGMLHFTVAEYSGADNRTTTVTMVFTAGNKTVTKTVTYTQQPMSTPDPSSELVVTLKQNYNDPEVDVIIGGDECGYSVDFEANLDITAVNVSIAGGDGWLTEDEPYQWNSETKKGFVHFYAETNRTGDYRSATVTVVFTAGTATATKTFTYKQNPM